MYGHFPRLARPHRAAIRPGGIRQTAAQPPAARRRRARARASAGWRGRVGWGRTGQGGRSGARAPAGRRRRTSAGPARASAAGRGRAGGGAWRSAGGRPRQDGIGRARHSAGSMIDSVSCKVGCRRGRDTPTSEKSRRSRPPRRRGARDRRCGGVQACGCRHIGDLVTGHLKTPPIRASPPGLRGHATTCASHKDRLVAFERFALDRRLRCLESFLHTYRDQL